VASGRPALKDYLIRKFAGVGDDIRVLQFLLHQANRVGLTVACVAGDDDGTTRFDYLADHVIKVCLDI
jgi:hypothetical protein